MGQAEDVPVRRVFQLATFELACVRQPLVNHADAVAATTTALTSLLKPIARRPAMVATDRAVTARREPKFSGRQNGSRQDRCRVGPRVNPRLDPFSLPVRFEAADEAADGRRRIVELHRERVVVRRSVRGMRMALNMPVAAFRGVAIRLHREPGYLRKIPRRPRSPSCSNTTIRLCRCRCLLRPRPTTSSPNGSPGAACWAAALGRRR